MAVTHESHESPPRFYLTIGAILAVVTIVEPETIAGWLPGGDAAQAIATELIASAEGAVATTMAYVALGAAVVALVLFLIASPRGRKVGQ